jgi:hypothetical protein
VAIVRLEGLAELRNLMTSSGIEPATFHLVCGTVLHPTTIPCAVHLAAAVSTNHSENVFTALPLRSWNTWRYALYVAVSMAAITRQVYAVMSVT